MIYEYAQYSNVKIQQRNYIHGQYVSAAATVLTSCGLLQQHTAPGSLLTHSKQARHNIQGQDPLRSERNGCLLNNYKADNL
jgi:hypothetical protein